MDVLLHDLKYALRSLRQTPGLFLVAALSLGLGVAVNVTIYAGVDILLRRPLPYPNAARLLAVWTDNKERGWNQSSSSLADFVDWRRGGRTESWAAYAGGSFTLADRARPERVSGLRVSPDFFALLGVTPAIGRAFRPDEETSGQSQVAVLSDRFWRNRFAADSGVLGRSIRLDGRPYAIVGVLPAGFRFGQARDLFSPLEIPGGPDRASHFLSVIGLVRPRPPPTHAAPQASGSTNGTH